MSNSELVSCVMITRASRLPIGALAIGDFFAQTWPDRELVILHDGDDASHEAWSRLAAETRDAEVRVLQAPAGLTLGQLRNVAVDAARGHYVCQWDDDDRYHPQRIALQLAALRDASADFCFLRDQLHWFQHEGDLNWDDWNGEGFPLNFVQGSLLGKRALMPRYPEIALGEDTGAALAIIAAGHRIVRLANAGWCYVYIFHGGNVWDAAHHRAQSRSKQRSPAMMQNLNAQLRERLAEYQPPLVVKHA